MTIDMITDNIRNIIRKGENGMTKKQRVIAAIKKEKVDYVKNRGSILIDDFSKNIMEWKGKGGTGILFTTPKETEQELKRLGIL